MSEQITVNAPKRETDRMVAYWLLSVFGLIALIVVVGGVTRLTQSGLSMVTWKPVTGLLPPLNHPEWMAAFEEYKQFPQYQKMFSSMTLDEFKDIYFWEYVHRVLGRLVGVAFFVPWVVFVVRKKMSRAMTGLTAIAFVLGGLQGLLGWYMVKSGLVDNPAVSHYRLAAHLCLAFTVAMYVLWLALSILRRGPQDGHRASRNFGIAFGVFLLIQIMYGAFMAGTRAGYLYQTFPLMNGAFFPEGALTASPWWLNLFENLNMLNFIHRTLGWVVAIAGITLALYGLKHAQSERQKSMSAAIIGFVAAQFLLGVFVVLAPGVPALLGVAHQFGAFILLATTVAFVHAFTPYPEGAD